MVEEFNPTNPIYLQLAGRISRQIIRGELNSGDKLPSVRDMAITSGVNPNTVQRTYSELERMGIVETRRGQGTFITEEKQVLIELREQLKDEQIDRFVNDMQDMGFEAQEIISGLFEFLGINDKGESKHD